MSEPKVSVIVPIYNTENELPECIQSIQDQTFSDIEIILVDDGSTDSSPQICDNIASMDSRILVLHKENGGLSDARNTGLLQAKGEYILFVDSDDYLEKDAVEQLLRGALPGVDLIAGAYTEWTEKKLTKRRTGLEDGKIYTSKEFIINSIKSDGFFMAVTWSYMYRRAYLLENNLLFKKGLFFEDLYLIIDLLLHTDSIIYIDYSFYNHVFREGSIIKSDNSLKKIHDNICVVTHWKETISDLEDKTLQKYLYYVLVTEYLRMCDKRALIGWDFADITFSYAFNHSLGLKQHAKIILFELKTIFHKLIPQLSDSQHLLTIEEYNSILAAKKDTTKEDKCDG